jgi:biopolymer transport protein ExbD
MAVNLTAENSRWSPSKAAARRAAKRQSQYYSGIDLTAFVSIELALLLMLIPLTPPFHSREPVDLPRARNTLSEPGANRDDMMRVTVTRAGNTYFGTSRIAASELHGRLRAQVQNGSEPKVYLYVDERAKNGDVEPVIDEIQLAGIMNIAIIAWGPSGTPASPAPKIPILYRFYFPDMREIPVRPLSGALSRTHRRGKSTDPAR